MGTRRKGRRDREEGGGSGREEETRGTAERRLGPNGTGRGGNES